MYCKIIFYNLIETGRKEPSAMIINGKSTRSEKGFCAKRHEFLNLKLKGEDSEILKISDIARNAVKLYKSETLVNLSDVQDFISEELEKLNIFSLKRQVLTEQIYQMVSRYLQYDPRRSLPVKPRKIDLPNGDSIISEPDFLYVSDNVIHVVSFSAGKQKMSNKIVKNKYSSSMKYCPDTLGLLLYGMDIAKEKNIIKGKLIVSYDALKSKQDKNGDYSAEYTAKPDGKASTFNDHKVLMSFSFDCNELSCPIDNYIEAVKAYKLGKFLNDSKECENCEYYRLCTGAGNDNCKFSVPKKSVVVSSSDTLFTSEQEEVLEFEYGVCLVNAGAGSGKTNTLAYRIGNLILGGCPPEDILIISFSDAAISEMKNRLKKVGKQLKISDDTISKICVRTFNSLGDYLIRCNYKKFGFTKCPTLINSISEYKLVLEAAEEYGIIQGLDYANMHMDFGKVKGAGKYLWSEFKQIRLYNLSESDYCANFYTADDRRIHKEVWDNYMIYKRLLLENNMIDYSDQINRIGDIIRNGEESIITDSLAYQHIIVDEFQDSSDDQISILNVFLNSRYLKSMMLVGDPSQAIYGFRGTSPENILNLDDKLLSNFKTIYLSKNFRSGQAIINAGEKILDISGQATSRHSISNNTNGAANWTDAGQIVMGDAVQDFIRQCQNYENSDIAIIAHNTSTLCKIWDLLDNIGVKADIKTSKSVLSDKTVISAISFIKYVRNNEDTISLMKYLEEVQHLDISDIEYSRNIIEHNVNVIPDMLENKTGFELLGYLMYCLEALENPANIVYHTFLENLKSQNFINADDLISYVTSIHDYDLDYKVTVPSDENSITLTTAHGAKGKEWRAVLVVTSDFRLDDVEKGSKEYLESMRLLYVAITRAREYVDVYGAKSIFR